MLNKPRILVVEDESGIADTIQYVLATDGFAPVWCSTADQALAEKAVADGADLIAFGKPYIANPDLVERLRAGAPLNIPDKATFYGGREKGYTDYPTLLN